ncbi:MAG: hypothetical protein M5U14_16470 [Acidimicrobiia bacterium]|nr:hypothetical protein [Acidimicrobiia bacterium]
MSDWTTEAADSIEQIVTTVRERTVEPAQRATRAVVYGLLVVFFVATAFALVTLGAFRLLDRYLPGGTWSAWLVLGGIFVVSGGFCWTRR